METIYMLSTIIQGIFFGIILIYEYENYLDKHKQ